MPALTLRGENPRRDAREAEGAPLLREYRVKSSIEGSNPSLSATIVFMLLNYIRIIRHV